MIWRALFLLLVLNAAGNQAVGASTSQWPDEQRVGPYHFRADFQIEDVQLLVNELVELERDVSSLLAIGSPTEPILIHLFQNRQSYQNYIRKHFPKIPNRKALYIKRNGPGMIFVHASDDLLNDLRHEVTHAILHASLAVVPLWLDEGLAEYFEVAATERVYGNQHLASAKWRHRVIGFPGLRKLERIDLTSRMRKTEYTAAWSWVHFMLHGNKAAKQELLAYLADIRNMNPPGQLSHRLEERVERLDEKYRSHLRTWPAKSSTATSRFKPDASHR